MMHSGICRLDSCYRDRGNPSSANQRYVTVPEMRVIPARDNVSLHGGEPYKEECWRLHAPRFHTTRPNIQGAFEVASYQPAWRREHSCPDTHRVSCSAVHDNGAIRKTTQADRGDNASVPQKDSLARSFFVGICGMITRRSQI